MSAFGGSLIVSLLDGRSNDGRGEWVLVQPFRYSSDIAGCTIEVPAGFRTDFASVPRAPLAIYLQNHARKAAVIHDYLYTVGELPKSVCDKVFYEAGLVEGYSPQDMRIMYDAVVRFGARHYNGTADDENAWPAPTGGVFDDVGAA